MDELAFCSSSCPKSGASFSVLIFINGRTFEASAFAEGHVTAILPT
jgi:hypothetical protein